MCVIAVVKQVRPTTQQIAQMFEANDFGAGVAWRDTRADGTPIVRWKKGLLIEEVQQLNQELPLPFVLHFRVPSHDTSKSLLACHPFVINDDATADWEGETEGHVLFHNGYWTDWRNKLQLIAMQGFVRIPSGPWSDSRGLAWAANHLGLGFLEMANEKVVAFGAGEDDLELFGTWLATQSPDADGKMQNLLVSNKMWEKSAPFHQVTDRRNPNLAPLALLPGGAAADQDKSFRREAQSAAGRQSCGEDQQESVQEEAQGAQCGGQKALRLCAGPGCLKRTATGQWLNDQFYCWHCWAERTQPLKGKLMGTCATCLIEYSAAKVIETHEWICSACWFSNGRPKIAYVLGDKEQYD